MSNLLHVRQNSVPPSLLFAGDMMMDIEDDLSEASTLRVCDRIGRHNDAGSFIRGQLPRNLENEHVATAGEKS